MPVSLKKNDLKLWQERTAFIARLKKLVGFCELSGKTLHLDAHEFLCKYGARNKPEANRLFMLHPGNILVINNGLHINQKPSVEACIVALYRRRLDVCRTLGFSNGRAMMMDFCKKVVRLQQNGFIKILPPYILTFSQIS